MKNIKLRRGFTEIEDLYQLTEKHNAIICGGYARYCASPLPTPRVVAAQDVDLFPRSEKSHEGLLKELKSWGYEIRHENHVSITLKAKEEFETKLAHIPTPQIIKPVVEGKIVTVGTVEEILSNFDFTIVRAAIINSTIVMVDDDFEDDEMHKVLKLKNIHCPISSLLRCCKYTRKGYFLRPAEALKLFIDWDNRGPEYKENMIELFGRSAKGEKTKDNPDGMTQEEIDELEALLRID